MGLQCISMAVNPDQLGYGAPINLFFLLPIPTGTALPRMHEFTMKKWDASKSGVSNEQYFDYQDLI